MYNTRTYATGKKGKKKIIEEQIKNALHKECSNSRLIKNKN